MELSQALLPQFLSIQAQDFIEERHPSPIYRSNKFLSIQAQDFIEDHVDTKHVLIRTPFLSIQAQDFIEEALMSSRPAQPGYS